jgi:hypothetical protein
MVCGRRQWRLGSPMPLGDEMLAGTGMADDCGLAFLGDYVCLRKFRPGRDTISSVGRARGMMVAGSARRAAHFDRGPIRVTTHSTGAAGPRGFSIVNSLTAAR